MNRDILALIHENMDTFSKGQKRIANYILESYDKAAFMTASKLGKRVNVSESTVVRFAAELGYDGYPSMQRSDPKPAHVGTAYRGGQRPHGGPGRAGYGPPVGH